MNDFNVIIRYISIFWSIIPLLLITYYIIEKYETYEVYEEYEKRDKCMSIAMVGMTTYIFFELVILFLTKIDVIYGDMIIQLLKFTRTIVVVGAIEVFKKRKFFMDKG
ncbi:hypothetical protein QBE52_12015 [Clostridiaceae bacterium 35-E11]